MKHLSGKGIVTRENLFAVTFLFVYALILLVADPEWLMWAGPITLGAFPVETPRFTFAIDPVETLQGASYAVLPGLLALILLMRIRGAVRISRRSEAMRPPAADGHGAAHAEPEHRKAA
ncbi:MAG TPA: hypothetical protein VK863_07420 [Candidatus Limnocylindrales bacterium]|nr:hypothetical protein [Candidatus Limnocylindrales bacterium]